MAATIGPKHSQNAKANFMDRIAFTSGEVAAYYHVQLPKLFQRGRQWRGVCPLHGGKRFSLSVNSETGQWYCFADCGRGGSILDFEMLLTGTDFKTALLAVYATIGRVMPEQARFTREEWRAAQQAAKRAEQDRRDADLFAHAAIHIMEGELERLPYDSSERQVWTHVLATLRADPVAIYRTCRENDETFAEAFVRVGNTHQERAQMRLAEFVMRMSSEGT